jgi:Caudovirus prohead protease.
MASNIEEPKTDEVIMTDEIKNEEVTEAQERHIVAVQETDETVTVTFEKHHDEEVESEEIETEEVEEERFDRSALTFRAAEVTGSDDKSRRVRMSLSSEEPVERSFGMEVLEHTDEAIDLSRLASGHAPLLLDHDMTKQIGVIETVSLDKAERKLRAVVRFGKSALAREVYDDVKDNIRSNVSIGYLVRNMEAKNDRSGTVSVNSWQPYEASIVSVPADAVVGINRSAEIIETTPETIIVKRTLK